MGDFLFELLASLFGGLIPERTGEIILGAVMALACLAFAALGAFLTWQILTKRADWPIGLGVLFLFSLSTLCGRLALRGFRPDHS